MEYKRLKENLNVMCMHNHGKGKVLMLTDGRKTENQVIDEIVSDCRKILDKIEQGTLIELPCKVGDTVYNTDGIRVYQGKILEISLTSKHFIFTADTVCFDERAIGERVFLTREEAEKRLKEIKNG